MIIDFKTGGISPEGEPRKPTADHPASPGKGQKATPPTTTSSFHAKVQGVAHLLRSQVTAAPPQRRLPAHSTDQPSMDQTSMKGKINKIAHLLRSSLPPKK